MDILVGRIIWLYVANLGSQCLESTMASSSSRSAMGRRRGRRSRVELPMPTKQVRSRDRVDEQTVLDIVGLIYDAALDADHWPLVLSRLAGTVGGSAGVLVFADVDAMRVSSITHGGLDPSAIAPYEKYYVKRDVWLMEGARIAVGGITTGSWLVPNERLIESEYYNDFLRHYDMQYLLTAELDRKGTAQSFVSIQRSASADDFGEAEIKTLRPFVRHLQHALRIASLSAGNRVQVDLLDFLPIGVILLDARGHPYLMNMSAEEIIALNDGLAVAHGSLRAESRLQTLELRNLIDKTLLAAKGVGAGADSGIAISRPSLKRPYEVLVVPLDRIDMAFGHRKPAAVIFLNDPERRPETHEESLQRLYGLTAAEVGLVAALVEETSLKAAAERRAISEGTARVYLKRVFQKTGVNSQAALMKLVLSGPAALNVHQR